MSKAVLVIEGSGEDYQLDHEELQTITDALGREQARALALAADCTKVLEPDPQSTSDEATVARVRREKALTWNRMLARVLNRLG